MTAATWDVRPMADADIPAIIELDLAAGGAAQRPRNSAFLSLALSTFPAGCSVAVSNGTLVGCVFCHRWGSLGWIGPLLVHPSSQGQGIGTALLRSAIESLSGKAEIIGVQAPADCRDAFSFYLSSGFQLVEPQILISHSAEPPRAASQDVVRRPVQDHYMCMEVGQSLAGASLGAWIGLGRAEQQAGGVSIEFEPRRELHGQRSAVVCAGVVPRSLGCEALGTAMESACGAAHAAGSSSVFVALNATYQREIDFLRSRGWRIRGLQLRMVYAKAVTRYRQMLSLPQVDATNWTL
ncbi:GNAT family N-acetyltransferase [bacterium]|nr:GNAT family N-acetyltransferase [bacterium]